MSQFYRYGDVVHYRWGGASPRPHSAAMVISRTRDDMLLLLALNDNYWKIDPYKPLNLTAKVAAMYEHCYPFCEYHPDNYKETK